MDIICNSCKHFKKEDNSFVDRIKRIFKYKTFKKIDSYCKSTRSVNVAVVACKYYVNKCNDCVACNCKEIK